MVSWGWIPIALFIGVCIGILLVGLTAANDFREEQEEKQNEQRGVRRQ